MTSNHFAQDGLIDKKNNPVFTEITGGGFVNTLFAADTEMNAMSLKAIPWSLACRQRKKCGPQHSLGTHTFAARGGGSPKENRSFPGP